MNPEQYQREQARSHAALAKAKGRRLLEQSYKARTIMAKYTNKAIAERHHQTAGMVSDMRNGYEPPKMPEKIRRRIRMDFMRHDDAARDYMSLDAIADHLNVARSTVRKWPGSSGWQTKGRSRSARQGPPSR